MAVDPNTGQSDLGTLGQALLKANYVPNSGDTGIFSQMLQTWLLNGGMQNMFGGATVDTGQPGGTLGTQNPPGM